MAGLGDLFNKDGLNRLGAGLAGAAGQMVGGKINEAAKPGVDAATQGINNAASTANNWLKVKGLQVVISTQLPDELPLDKSKGMTQYVENGLTALGHFKGKPDGTADKQTLDAVNKLRESGGKEPLTNIDQFGKSDLKLMVDKLADKGTPHANNVIDAGTSTVSGLKSDYPKPQAPAQTQSYDPSMGGG